MNPFTFADKKLIQQIQENLHESAEEGGISPERLEVLGLERAIHERFFGSTSSSSVCSSTA